MRQENCTGNNGSKGLIALKHHGHYSEDGRVGLSFSTRKNLQFNHEAQKSLKKHHLYFVSFRKGRVWRCLAQHRRLPSNLFRINSQELEPCSI